MLTKRSMEKGLYQARGIEEITNLRRTINIASSRERMGYARRMHTIGMMRGDVQASLAIKEHLRSAISPVITMPAMVRIEAMTDDLASRNLFGDAGAIRFPIGRQPSLFRGARAALQVERTFSAEDYIGFVNQLFPGKKGAIGREALLSDIADVMSGGSFKKFDLPIPETLRRNRNFMRQLGIDTRATHLVGVSSALRSAQVKFYFRTSSVSEAAANAMLLNKNTRLAVRNVNPQAITLPSDILPGARELAFDLAIGADISLDRPSALFYHRTGLLGTKYRTPTALTSATERFVESINKFAGGDILGFTTDLGEPVITHGRGYTQEAFEKATMNVLTSQEYGFTPRQVQGFAFTYGGVSGMDVLQLGKNIRATEQTKNTLQLILGLSARAGETEDFYRQTKAFRIRLQELGLVARSSVGMAYDNPADNPLIKMMSAIHKQASDKIFSVNEGMRLNLKALHSGNLIRRMPTEMTYLASMFSQELAEAQPFEKGGKNWLRHL